MLEPICMQSQKHVKRLGDKAAESKETLKTILNQDAAAQKMIVQFEYSFLM